MTTHPIVAVYPDGSAVAKSDVRGYEESRVRLRSTVTEVRSIDLTTSFGVDIGGSLYDRDPTDTTTADNGTTCIVDAAGNRFKIITALNLPVATAITYGAVLAMSAPAHQFLTGLSSGIFNSAQPTAADIAGLRTQATGTVTLFVSTTGSDTLNTGLTSGSPFATIQHAVSVLLASYDLRGNGNFIQLADGTYTEYGIKVFGLNGALVDITICGASGHGAAVIWNVPTGQAGIGIKDFAAVTFQDITIEGGTGAECISVDQSGILDIEPSVVFGNCPAGTHIAGAHGASLNLNGYSITGTSYAFHIFTEGDSNISIQGTITLAAATFTDFILAWCGFVDASSVVFAGAGAGSGSTGQKYLFQYGAVLMTGGVNPDTIFPGATNGSIQLNGANGRDYDGGKLAQGVFVAAAVNFNAANTDTVLPITLPPGAIGYVVNNVRIAPNATHSLTGATIGVFTAASGGGTPIVTGGSAVTVTNGTLGSANNTQALTIAATQAFNNTSLFIRIGTAEGAAATADVQVQLAWLY